MVKRIVIVLSPFIIAPAVIIAYSFAETLLHFLGESKYMIAGVLIAAGWISLALGFILAKKIFVKFRQKLLFVILIACYNAFWIYQMLTVQALLFK